MANFPAVLSVVPDGELIIRLTGLASGDQAGYSVSATGDINGDGIADLIIGARGVDATGTDAGAAYVVFGRAGGWGDLNLADLDGTDGFRIQGATTGDLLGQSAVLADLNNDGFADIAIGAHTSDVDGVASGDVYVLYGKADGWAAVVSVAGLDGSDGFRINGGAANDTFGTSLSAGDFNGDGVQDLMVLAGGADYGGVNTGAAYIVFGTEADQSSVVQASTLDTDTIIQFAGAETHFFPIEFGGRTGDYNGDGFDDLLVGFSTSDLAGVNRGSAYLVFGSANDFTASQSVAGLDGSNGVTFLGLSDEQGLGAGTAGLGDLNGDGLDELFIGSSSGPSYIVFGRSGGWPANFDLGSLDGSNGFSFAARSDTAFSGDFNGDGLLDVALNSGTTTHVLYGSVGGYQATYATGDFTGGTGFRIINASDRLSVGDLNGDGLDDLVFGGIATNGRVDIVFGRQGDLTLTGTAGAETIEGRSANDTITGLGGKDELLGLGGDDLLDGGDSQDRLFGGDGNDELWAGAGNDNLWGDDGNDQLFGVSGANKLFGGAGDDILTGGTGNDRLDGGEDNDTLTGGAGNDLLDGGLGTNGLSGGAGNDVYMVRSVNDTVTELAAEGIDSVRSTISYTLGDHVENLELLSVQNRDGTGNALANRLTGNSGNNTLSGLAGNDTLVGGDGDDILIGGLGKDTLTGGLGADTFRYLQESIGLGGSELDNITDFSTAEGDRFDFSAIDADSGTDADQAFVLAESGFTKAAGEMFVFYTASQDQTVIRLDVDGDGLADLQLRVSGDVTGDTAGWLL
jgi:hypothetical protein